MTAIGTINQNSICQNFNGDVTSNKGMFGQTIQVTSVVNFSIDPSVGNLSGTQNKYYHTYLVNTTGHPGINCIITMQNTVGFNNGWRTRIKNTAGIPLDVRNFTGTTVAIIRVGFAAELILTAVNTWAVNFEIPKLTPPIQSGTVITYDSNGYPQISVFTGSSLLNGIFTAKTNTVTVLNTGAFVPVLWNTQIVIDPTYYTNNALTGAITINTTGRYSIDVVVGVNIAGGSNANGLNIRIRRNGVNLNSLNNSSNIPTFASNVFTASTIHAFVAGDILTTAGFRSPAGGNFLNTATPDGCWIQIRFIGT